MKTLTSLAAVVTFLMSFLTGLGGQTVRQGDPSVRADPTAFHSPMILETAFIAANPATWTKKGWLEDPEYHDLGKFRCDGISIRGSQRRGEWTSGLAMKVKPLKDNKLEVTIQTTVINPKHNHDKAVTLFFEILSGENLIGSLTVGPIGTEEDESPDTGSAKIVLNADALKTNPKARLRITMNVRDD